MEAIVVQLADAAELVIEAVVVVIVIVGTLEAVTRLIWRAVMHGDFRATLREVWLRYAAWIVLALEFALAADLIGTVVSPSWDEIGQLAAIGALRTALSYFLGRDIAEFSRFGDRPATEEP